MNYIPNLHLLYNTAISNCSELRVPSYLRSHSFNLTYPAFALCSFTNRIVT